MRSETWFDQLGRATQPRLFGVTFVLLRLALGAMFFFSGIQKLGDWTATPYLLASTGPFATFFQSLAGSAFVDALNAWGMLAIGAALLLGLLVRPAAVCGAVLMLLYYFAAFTENTAHGYVDQHIIFALIFVLFAAGGAGHVFGMNTLAERMVRRPGAWIRGLLG